MNLISKKLHINKEFIVEHEYKKYKFFIDCSSTQFQPGKNGVYIYELAVDEVDNMLVEEREIDEVTDEEEFNILYDIFSKNINQDDRLPEATLVGFMDYCKNSINESITNQKQVDEQLRTEGYAIPEKSVPIAVLDMIKDYLDEKYKNFCNISGIVL